MFLSEITEMCHPVHLKGKTKNVNTRMKSNLTDGKAAKNYGIDLETFLKRRPHRVISSSVAWF